MSNKIDWFNDYGIVIWPLQKIDSVKDIGMSYQLEIHESTEMRDAAIMQHLTNLKNSKPKTRLVAREFIKARARHWN